MAEAERRGDPQAAAEVASGQDRLHRLVDLSTGSHRMVAKREAGFREGRTVDCSRQQLDPEIRLEPARGGRYAAGVGDLHEGPQLFDVQFGVPDCATQLGRKRRYRITF
ncbi:hypothetical protein JOD31_002622 [Methylopila capsulata]|uniref:Uncharacterized protein n=1 Tax=Methylopila capsulata TaxID=61654 RepID=A0ABS2T871_9HYPH|nr:hypothetical protein [Methylopila capsulata]